MKLDTFKRINIEDYPSQYQDLVSKLGYSINPFGDQVVQTLTNNVSITDNLAQNIKTITLSVDVNGSPLTPTQLKTGLTAATNGILVIQATNTTSVKTYPTSTPFVSYTENAGLITINNISGLQTGNKYSLKLLIL